MTILAYRDSQPESRDFWKNELTQAVSEIRQMYDDKVEDMRGQMESSCNEKVRSIERNISIMSCKTSKQNTNRYYSGFFLHLTVAFDAFYCRYRTSKYTACCKKRNI